MRSIHNEIKPVQSLQPQTVTSGGGAVNTSDIDLQGFDAAEIIVNVGANGGDTLNGTNKFTLKLEHADDDGTGAADSYAAVGDTDIVGATQSSGVFATIDDAAEDSMLYRLGYIGGKRFIKVTITPAGTLSNGNPFSVTIIKGHPYIAPTSAN